MQTAPTFSVARWRWWWRRSFWSGKTKYLINSLLGGVERLITLSIALHERFSRIRMIIIVYVYDFLAWIEAIIASEGHFANSSLSFVLLVPGHARGPPCVVIGYKELLAFHTLGARWRTSRLPIENYIWVDNAITTDMSRILASRDALALWIWKDGNFVFDVFSRIVKFIDMLKDSILFIAVVE